MVIIINSFNTGRQYRYDNPYDYSSYQKPWCSNANPICSLCGINIQKSNSTSSGITESQFNLSNRLRELWEQHTVWTRATIVSMIFDLPDVEFVTARLLQNPDDFGNLFREYYGDRIGSKFRDLIKDHLVIAAQLVAAAKAGDSKTAEEAEKRWYANGDEIATFLASINSNWSEDDWMNMFRTHLGLVKSSAVILLTKNYSEEATVYDVLESQALEMADMMTQGIVRQFADKFK